MEHDNAIPAYHMIHFIRDVLSFGSNRILENRSMCAQCSPRTAHTAHMCTQTSSCMLMENGKQCHLWFIAHIIMRGRKRLVRYFNVCIILVAFVWVSIAAETHTHTHVFGVENWKFVHCDLRTKEICIMQHLINHFTPQSTQNTISMSLEIVMNGFCNGNRMWEKSDWRLVCRMRCCVAHGMDGMDACGCGRWLSHQMVQLDHFMLDWLWLAAIRSLRSSKKWENAFSQSVAGYAAHFVKSHFWLALIVNSHQLGCMAWFVHWTERRSLYRREWKIRGLVGEQNRFQLSKIEFNRLRVGVAVHSACILNADRVGQRLQLFKLSMLVCHVAAQPNGWRCVDSATHW